MKNSFLLFNNIKKSGKNYIFHKKKPKVLIDDILLGGKGIKKLISVLRFVIEEIHPKKLLIEFRAHNVRDFAVIQQLEIIFAYLLENNVEEVTILFDRFEKNSIHYFSLKNSVFGRCDYLLNKADYLNKYYKESHSEQGGYFRYYISNEQRDTQINYIMHDILSLTNLNTNDNNYSLMVAKAFTEIIDNVRHANSDCIASIQFNKQLINNFSDVKAIGYFVCITNVSEKCVFSNLLDGILNNSLRGKTKDIIDRSFSYHKKYFDIKDYSLERYCLISVFQKSITTDSQSGNTGGTGLTDIIKLLLVSSSANNCYVLSGKHALFFKEKLIKVDDKGNIGFNENNNYFSDIPSNETFSFSPFIYPGTIFLLELIKEVNL